MLIYQLNYSQSIAIITSEPISLAFIYVYYGNVHIYFCIVDAYSIHLVPLNALSHGCLAQSYCTAGGLRCMFFKSWCNVYTSQPLQMLEVQDLYVYVHLVHIKMLLATTCKKIPLKDAWATEICSCVHVHPTTLELGRACMSVAFMCSLQPQQVLGTT